MHFTQYGAKQAYRLCFDEHTLYFSYNTVIGYEGSFGAYVTAKQFSQTTNRHKRVMGIAHHPELSQRELMLLADKALAHYGLKMLRKNLGHSDENSSFVATTAVNKVFHERLEETV